MCGAEGEEGDFLFEFVRIGEDQSGDGEYFCVWLEDFWGYMELGIAENSSQGQDFLGFAEDLFDIWKNICICVDCGRLLRGGRM